MLFEIATTIGYLFFVVAIGAVVAVSAIVLFMFTGAALTWLAILVRLSREARKQRDEVPSQRSGDSKLSIRASTLGAILN
jgi:hypothetical protein